MSRSNRSYVRIGCPDCDVRVDAPVPPGPGIISQDEEPNRLRGTAAHCRNCGYELELYYY